MTLNTSEKNWAQLVTMYYSTNSALNPDSAANFILDNHAMYSLPVNKGRDTLYLFSDDSIAMLTPEKMIWISETKGVNNLVAVVKRRGKRLTHATT